MKLGTVTPTAMRSLRVDGLLAGAAALALAALACVSTMFPKQASAKGAGSDAAPKIVRDLELADTSNGKSDPLNGVMVSFVADHRPASVRVTIDGYRGAIYQPWTRRVIRYFWVPKVLRGHFKLGHRYTVRITMCSSSHKCSRTFHRLTVASQKHLSPI